MVLLLLQSFSTSVLTLLFISKLSIFISISSWEMIRSSHCVNKDMWRFKIDLLKSFLMVERTILWIKRLVSKRGLVPNGYMVIGHLLLNPLSLVVRRHQVVRDRVYWVLNCLLLQCLLNLVLLFWLLLLRLYLLLLLDSLQILDSPVTEIFTIGALHLIVLDQVKSKFELRRVFTHISLYLVVYESISICRLAKERGRIDLAQFLVCFKIFNSSRVYLIH